MRDPAAHHAHDLLRLLLAERLEAEHLDDDARHPLRALIPRALVHLTQSVIERLRAER